MIIVSACLAGCECRYDGKSNEIPEIKQLVLENKALALCPEVLGGLGTPRISCEIVQVNNELKVIDQDKNDYTSQFTKGAEIVINVAKALNCNMVILKANSPSCGYGKIYDGSFTGKHRKGNGLTAELLAKNGVQIRNEVNFHSLLDNEK
ncbi:hypothetical protein BZG02_16345 [Labilibaculum filiforme]|uniref:Uncharacterized protein n=1 Tax=Labilibaculum filiforme TaxID=1940526 RepID=A0A2N3HT40_9BACT|nr:DUF523 domain-containing protein [Labilibaculum filiforme]PKQ61203.1 hypothetical protein BZG02_16345 [Labilibaculum filiforme]